MEEGHYVLFGHLSSKMFHWYSKISIGVDHVLSLFVEDLKFVSNEAVDYPVDD